MWKNTRNVFYKTRAACNTRSKVIIDRCNCALAATTFQLFSEYRVKGLPKISLRLVFTSDGVVVGVVIRSVERYDLVKIKPTESKAEQ